MAAASPELPAPTIATRLGKAAESTDYADYPDCSYGAVGTLPHHEGISVIRVICGFFLSNASNPRSQTWQANLASSASHSEALRALRARKLMPRVPNFAALDACGAPLNTSARQVISKPVNPAATTVACDAPRDAGTGCLAHDLATPGLNGAD